HELPADLSHEDDGGIGGLRRRCPHSAPYEERPGRGACGSELQQTPPPEQRPALSQSSGHTLLVPQFLLVSREDGPTSPPPRAAPFCQSLRPKRGRFEHGTGAAVKALGGPSGELEQQRAGSVAKKKAGRAGPPPPARQVRTC